MDNQSPEIFGQTPWQTVGPFFHYCLPWKGGADLAGQSAQGARTDLLEDGHDHLPARGPNVPAGGLVMDVSGRVLDGNGDPVPDALLEIWHADASGNYQTSFATFGRCATSDDGGYRFTTVRPGPVRDAQGVTHAPHIAVAVFARGIIKRLLTRLYFAGAPENASDPVLLLVPETRREQLIARETSDGWHFDIVLQGPGETVFFV